MSVPVGILGAGAWGTALAQALASDGSEVVIWAREPELVEAGRLAGCAGHREAADHQRHPVVSALGGHDGEHHKAWVIDQMVRVLAGDHYDALVAAARAGDDGPETYDWDTGVAP